MENLANIPSAQSDFEPAQEQRSSPRFTLLIRAAKLIGHQGEFVCVIRDVSDSGVSVRLFHACPTGEDFDLHMPGGEVYKVKPVWAKDQQAGFEFVEPVDVAQMINEAGEYPKRGLRLGVCLPAKVRTLTQSCEAVIENLSQQGALIDCDTLFAKDQALIIECEEFNEVRGKVRWRRETQHGIVFDDTFTLGDFARMVCRVQAPALLQDH